MNRPFSFLLAAVATLTMIGCSSIRTMTGEAGLVEKFPGEFSEQLTPGYGIAERGRAIIGDTLDAELLSDLVIDYLNLYRAKFSLPRLWPEVHAMRTARWMAEWQAKQSVVSHVTNVPGMDIFPKRYRKLGGSSYARGVENAGWYDIFDVESDRNMTYDEMARRIVDGWINSPGHRKNLLASEGPADGTVGLWVALGTYQGNEGIFSTMNAFFPWPEDINTVSTTPMARNRQTR